jgi:glycine cleavage system H protein
MNPENLLYTKDHEWIRVDGDTGTIGITDHAQSELGDVVFVELPKTGANFHSHDAFGSIESVKAVSEVYSPVGGEVIETNPILNERPEVVNADPYGDGWMMKIRLSSPDELKELMTAVDYDTYVKNLEGH